jgi:transcriptional regulator of acetoin/glycerol metabolism
VLWKGGDREIVSATDKIAFVPGADWSERGAGTNAMGTAIAVDHQVQIFSAEHFSMDVHPWHCCAAPVHDPAIGELAAVIDLTGRLKTAHPHTLGLVTAAAGVAETYLRRDLAVHDERAKALFLARVTGTRERTALLRRNGEVVAASRRHPRAARRASSSFRPRRRRRSIRAARPASWRRRPAPTCSCCGAGRRAVSITSRPPRGHG